MVQHEYPVTVRRLGMRKINVSEVGFFPSKDPPNLIKRFMGISRDHKVPRLDNHHITMVVDGSVKHQQGGAGVVLKDDRGRLTKILVPVDGNKCDTTSYRRELNAIYSGYLFLTKTTCPEKQSQ